MEHCTGLQLGVVWPQNYQQVHTVHNVFDEESSHLDGNLRTHTQAVWQGLNRPPRWVRDSGRERHVFTRCWVAEGFPTGELMASGQELGTAPVGKHDAAAHRHHLRLLQRDWHHNRVRALSLLEDAGLCVAARAHEALASDQLDGLLPEAIDLVLQLQYGCDVAQPRLRQHRICHAGAWAPSRANADTLGALERRDVCHVKAGVCVKALHYDLGLHSRAARGASRPP
eukprot:361100-Chlamydomonas_euryale.AAC.18